MADETVKRGCQAPLARPRHDAHDRDEAMSGETEQDPGARCRRLVDTGCFIGGKLTAFVGPNEAGKSSLLAALETVNEPDEVPQRDRPRGRESGDDDVSVELTFRLDSSDLCNCSPALSRPAGLPGRSRAKRWRGPVPH